ncbi:type IV secretion protein Rhs [Psychrobacter pocilloporae]|uniref:type IV secretion protein Rhs n=1 Tax=Psychrobacter pocilloporae TaxID=1775882 RepID=UPI003C2AE748
MSKPTLKRLFNRYLRNRNHNQQSRCLTVGEIALARSVFGDSIRLDEVRLKTTWWVLKSYAVSPNGHIYFNPADWITDFSVASLGKQSWLIHELTHVWQLQQGLKVVRGALIDRRYDYVLETGKSFFKYGIEQQARMVQDYFVRHQKGQDCQDLEACIPFLTVNAMTDKKRANSNFTA